MILPRPASTLFPYTTLFRSYVIRGDAVREGMRSAGILGDVPAERAGLLARWIRHEIEAMRRDRGRKMQVDHAGSIEDRKSTRLNSSHLGISYAVFCLKKKKK